LEESRLIQALRAGDEQAFRLLVEQYRNKVYHTVLNMLQDPDDANDTAQEVFVQVYESVGDFKEQSSLSTWIYRIAIRKALDKLRKKKNRERLHRFLPWWMPQEKKSTEFHHPGITYDQKEKAAALFRAIGTLPERQQTAFTLIKVQGMSYTEAAQIMQQGIKALESLVDRAKKNLQIQLQQYNNPQNR
jgi:RNA polymerase sigma factor (sigma-70 family)